MPFSSFTPIRTGSVRRISATHHVSVAEMTWTSRDQVISKRPISPAQPQALVHNARRAALCMGYLMRIQLTFMVGCGVPLLRK